MLLSEALQKSKSGRAICKHTEDDPAILWKFTVYIATQGKVVMYRGRTPGERLCPITILRRDADRYQDWKPL